jgi:four helix bundle protein
MAFWHEQRPSKTSRSRISAFSKSTEFPRHSRREYLHFLNIAVGSAAEVEYLVTVAIRLALLPTDGGDELVRAYARLSAGLRALIQSISDLER